jgi:hypothetical protein
MPGLRQKVIKRQQVIKYRRGRLIFRDVLYLSTSSFINLLFFRRQVE